MSWILGFVGEHISSERREGLAAVHPPELWKSLGRTYYVAAGGLRETCHFGRLPERDGGSWCVVGTGVRLHETRCSILSGTDWRRRILAQRPRIGNLGGGFAVFRWTTRRVEGFSDALGLRPAYWARLQDGFVFSTRLDWLAALIGGAPLDVRALGTHLATQNQLSHRSLVKGIERMPPGGFLELTERSAHAEADAWTPPGRTRRSFADTLAPFLRPDADRAVSLGLSGGMDSRLLLALRPEESPFSVHSFGPPARKDVVVASRIADGVRIPFTHFHLPLPGMDEAVGLVRRHAVATNAVSPASAAPALRYYAALHAQGKIVLDGGFGEIVRRKFMNRLLQYGRDAILAKDTGSILPLLTFERTRVFSSDAKIEMRLGALQDVEELFEALPDPTLIGPENWADLASVRMRLPNFYGYEQARLDLAAVSYMPFAQPAVLDAVFDTIPARRHSTSRRLIAQRDRRLRRFPLVKSGVSYPYLLPDALATAYVLLRKRLSRWGESESGHLLRSIQPFVLDRVHSAAVRSCGLYDAAALEALGDAFYKTGRRAGELDWWLAFDLWREGVGG